ncbi:type II toxin-antitoxin system RelE/ParE family toxin [Taibaiella soli]|uniref:Toxin n=1 Tax=Taibaiella soli TaxID=1649169 RepID=A0A2W2B224_9BACT|nr:type II toxin-antitoxin system RelE/ParE family toxin [Taibaiella soli]PZF74314.1 type II toxin-antitoxin system RelE/ParE family toxin [Taibaiella soli]
MNYKISVKALDDIENIWLYTFENWSVEQADRYANLIFDEIEYLADYPNSGKDLGHIRKNYRCSKVKSHLIFYRYMEKQSSIEIVRILHERMQIENRLDD